MQKYNATVISTTGAPGSGKTYSRCARFLWDWWLPEEKGVHWSNFPVNFERFETKYPDVRERVQIYPDAEMERWALCDGISGPWEFFEHKDIEGAHIVFDECHNFLPRKGKGSQTNALRWAKWLGEIRHRGATVEFLSQDPHKVHSTVEEHSAVRIQLVNSEDRRDPLFNCLLGDWYELRASVTGSYEAATWQLEERRLNGKWVKAGFDKFTIQPAYFVLYNSFNAPHSGGTGAKGQDRIFQKRGRVGVVGWFVKRNWFRLLSRFALFCAAFWFCFGGGIPFAIDKFNTWVRSRAGGVPDPSKVAAAPVPVPRPDRVPVDPATLLKGNSKRKGSASGAPSVPDDGGAVPLPVALPLLVSTNGNAINGGVVRSETFKHRTLETPASGADQQAAVPRLVMVSKDFVSLDDGLILAPGDSCGAVTLKSIDFSRRLAVFTGVVINGVPQTLVVPVGGPLGVRLREPGPSIGGPQQVSPGLSSAVTGLAKPLR